MARDEFGEVVKRQGGGGARGKSQKIKDVSNRLSGFESTVRGSGNLLPIIFAAGFGGMVAYLLRPKIEVRVAALASAGFVTTPDMNINTFLAFSGKDSNNQLLSVTSVRIWTPGRASVEQMGGILLGIVAPGGGLFGAILAGGVVATFIPLMETGLFPDLTWQPQDIYNNMLFPWSTTYYFPVAPGGIPSTAQMIDIRPWLMRKRLEAALITLGVIAFFWFILNRLMPSIQPGQ